METKKKKVEKKIAEKPKTVTKKIATVTDILHKVEGQKPVAKKEKKVAKEKPIAKEKSIKKETTIATKTVVKKATKLVVTKEKKSNTISFQIHYNTEFGQALFITANHVLFETENLLKALPMKHLGNGVWFAELSINEQFIEDRIIIYNYVLHNTDGTISYDAGNDKTFNLIELKKHSLSFVDTWNYAGYYENAFYTKPFKNVLLNKVDFSNKKSATNATHIFKVKTPILAINQAICLIGSIKELGNWSIEKPIVLNKKNEDDFYFIELNLSTTNFPIEYKYGVYNTQKKCLVNYEDGDNRTLQTSIKSSTLNIINDGFLRIELPHWKGSGVAIPVFSLRSKNSWGVGEFNDIKQLANWSNNVGLKLIQLLPINDTTANYSFTDSYPYAAISVFALHPIYLHIPSLISLAQKSLLKTFEKERVKLNALPALDYKEVIALKWKAIKHIFPLVKDATFSSNDYKNWYQENKHWLLPYAVFCFLRDKNGTPNFELWKENKTFENTNVDAILKEFEDEVSIHFFVQYHLHLQLQDATKYAHSKGLVVKGDIAIGVYRYGADTWQEPHLYNMNAQAGAPPDDFAIKGQNWGFPTYNWQVMKQDNFAWWRNRFTQLSHYFDTFRIDHILGFFRIWTIPTNAVEGILGKFVPAIPIRINEFYNNNIYFDFDRYTKPFINNNVLNEIFGFNSLHIKEIFFGRRWLRNIQTKIRI